VPPESEQAFDPFPALRALADAAVDFVVIGGVAGGAHGSSYPTYDLDVAYARDRENLEHLAEALRSLGARLRRGPTGVPFLLDARTLEAGPNFTFQTDMGDLDILGNAAGAPPYHRLRADATTVDVDGRKVRIASLDHLIAMKEASGRTKDKLMATEYRTLSDVLRAPCPEPSG
jgi:predicted nucleotidyltransferase